MPQPALEQAASLIWAEEMRDRLDQLRESDDSGASLGAQSELRTDIAAVAQGIVDELHPQAMSADNLIYPHTGKDGRTTKRIDHLVRAQTIPFEVDYRPTELRASESSGIDRVFARVVTLETTTYNKRPFIPVFAGALALKEKVEEISCIGVEFSAEPRLLPSFTYEREHQVVRLLSIGENLTFIGDPKKEQGVLDLIEGLHAISASAIDMRDKGILSEAPDGSLYPAYEPADPKQGYQNPRHDPIVPPLPQA